MGKIVISLFYFVRKKFMFFFSFWRIVTTEEKLFNNMLYIFFNWEQQRVNIQYLFSAIKSRKKAMRMNFPDSPASKVLGLGVRGEQKEVYLLPPPSPSGSFRADALLIKLGEYWPSSFFWHFYGVRIISFRLICFFLSRERTLSGEMYSE